MPGLHLRCGLLVALALVMCGCASSKSSNTARTAQEQMLISNAVDQSLSKVDFSAFDGHAVYLNDKYVDCVDKAYVVSSVRHRILNSGASLVEDPATAEVLVELRCGAVGTDMAESFVGVPEVTLPGMLTLPEVRFLTRSTQKGTAKLGLVAVDARTNRVLGTGGVSLAQSNTQNWYVMGVGPFRSGSIDSEVHEATTGSASRIHNVLPASVAFQEPAGPETGPQEYAASEEGETKPVNFEAPPAPPAAESDAMMPPRRLSGE